MYAAQIPTTVSWSLPNWFSNWAAENPKVLPDGDDAAMKVAVDLLATQISMKTGGPFSAIIYDIESREIISFGVNRVVPCNNPGLHAETVAIQLATQRIGEFQFSGRFGMLASGQMCGMCLTASLWAGLGEIVIAARAEDTERETGFDEGIIPPDWLEQLEHRGVKVRTDVLRDAVVEEFRRYVAEGGFVYNGRRQ